MTRSLPWIPTEKVRPLLEEWHKRYSWNEIAALTDINPRMLYQIPRQEYVEFNTLDKLLVGMGALHLWHTTFAEYYLVESPRPLSLTVALASDA